MTTRTGLWAEWERKSITGNLSNEQAETWTEGTRCCRKAEDITVGAIFL